MKKVLLLKSETESAESYANLLRENDFESIFIPTLEFRFKQLDILKDKLRNPDGFSGIIFTSPRSVEACEQAIIGGKLDERWTVLHNYCVGEVTHNLVQSSLDLSPKGKHTGNANNLSDFIFESLDGVRLEQPFLFPCGNLKQDTLQSKLVDYGYTVDPLEVYETVAHSELETNLKDAFQQEGGIQYIAFFSPSGVTAVDALATKLGISLDDYKLIAIGPSTRKSLENLGHSAHKTAEKPSVEYLVKALLGS